MTRRALFLTLAVSAPLAYVIELFRTPISKLNPIRVKISKTSSNKWNVKVSGAKPGHIITIKEQDGFVQNITVPHGMGLVPTLTS